MVLPISPASPNRIRRSTLRALRLKGVAQPAVEAGVRAGEPAPVAADANVAERGRAAGGELLELEVLIGIS
jgi:hypothetical protein